MKQSPRPCTILRVALALALAACLPLLAGCGSEPARPLVALWQDASGSSLQSRALHAGAVVPVVDHAAREQGELLFDFIGASSRNPTWPVQRRFAPAPSTSGSEAASKRDLARQAASATGEIVAAIRRAPPTRGTDVLGALHASGQTLAAVRAPGPRYLVILSDLLDSRVRHARLTRPTLDRLLAHLRRANRLPRLDGVRVYFVTATLLARDELSQPKLDALERFYRRLVAAAGGTVAQYAPLLRFP